MNNRVMPTEFEVWRVRGAAAADPVVDEDTGRPMRVLGSYYLGAMGLSPDAARLVAIVHAEQIPSLWERYEVPGGLDGEPFHVDPPSADHGEVPLSKRESDYTRARQYQMIDVEKGTRHPLVDALLPHIPYGGNGRWVHCSSVVGGAALRRASRAIFDSTA